MMNMQAGIPKAQLMAGDAMNRALTRMAHEMMEQLMPLENVVLVGIRRRGVPLAQRLSDIIEKYEHVRIPVGEVGLNLVWGKKIRVANLLPSLLIAVIWAFL